MKLHKCSTYRAGEIKKCNSSGPGAGAAVVPRAFWRENLTSKHAPDEKGAQRKHPPGEVGRQAHTPAPRTARMKLCLTRALASTLGFVSAIGISGGLGGYPPAPLEATPGTQ